MQNLMTKNNLIKMNKDVKILLIFTAKCVKK